MPGLNIKLDDDDNNNNNNNNNNIRCDNLYNYIFFFVMKLNLFFYRVLIVVFKRRFEVNIKLIHDI